MTDKQKQWIEELLAKADVKINGERPWDIKVINPAVYDRVLAQGSLGFGESYMASFFECEALDELIYRLFLAKIPEKLHMSFPLALEIIKSSLFNLQSKSRSFEVGQKHYDLGNDFFAAMLGQSMVYSCGYWPDVDTLTQAQYAKLDLICRKLNLQKGQRVLDIGSGWGAFAKYATEHYGVFVTGVTVSKEQASFARQLCKGLPVEFLLQDYRTLNEKFDHIVSVGMFEHVGVKNYKTYMEVARRCLKENGLFLLHTIRKARSSDRDDPWMTKYIFPNGSLPSLAQIAKACETLFIVEDLHNFGADYDKTLMAWHQNFKNNWPTFKDTYGQVFYRMWRYYLLSLAGVFRTRHMQLWQIVLSPEGVLGGYKSVRQLSIT